MIDSGMPVIGASMRAIDIDLPAVDAARAATFDDISKQIFIATFVILLLPAILVICAVALFVPCLFRVPVCGTSASSTRMFQRM